MSDLRILIAEDDAGLGDLWQTAFQRAGYEVVLVVNGQQALDWLDANPLPDVAILDFNMPQVNGLQVLEHLHTLDPDQTVRTVMVTANHTVMDTAADKVDMFLQKPMGFKEMKTLVERLTHLSD